MHDHFATISRITRRLAFALPVVGAMSGCAPTPAPEATSLSIAPVHAEMQEAPLCHPDITLFTPQAAPDCKFGRPVLKTLDPDQWARLKIEYERQCYQRAEKTARERLRLLQVAARCEAESTRP